MRESKPLSQAGLRKIRQTVFLSSTKDGLPSVHSLGYLKTQVDLHPNSPDLLCFYADVLELTGDDRHPTPATYYKKALKVDPAHGPAFEGLGWFYEVRDKYALALRFFVRATFTAKPGDSIVGIARIQAQQGLRMEWEKDFAGELRNAKLSRWGRRMANEISRGVWDK
jgi:hypothetical protein